MATYVAFEGEEKWSRFHNLHIVINFVLPYQFVFDQAVGAQEVGAYGAVLNKTQDSRMLLFPMRVGTALRLVDLHNGSVQGLLKEKNR